VARPDLRIHPLHGNVDTRLRRLDAGETDALVLAVAGLTRLGRADRIGERLPVGVIPPAPGQGSLALQCRADDAQALAWVSRLDDPATRVAVEAERAFLAATGGGCRAPIGALGTVLDDELQMVAGTAGRDPFQNPDGGTPRVAWGEVRGDTRDRLGLAARLAAELTAQLAGAGDADREVGSAPAGGRRVLVTRPDAQAGPLVAALAREGFIPVAIPTIEIQPLAPGGELDAAIRAWDGSGWIAVTSANGATAVLDAARRLGVHVSTARWAAVGDATRAVLEARGILVAFVPSVADGARLAAELPLAPGTAVLLPRAHLADGRMVADLESRGATVTAVTAYRTVEGPESSRERLRAFFAGGAPDAIVFTSGSTVVGLHELLGASHRTAAQRTVACCIGQRTAAVARSRGFERIVTSPSGAPDALAALVAAALGEPAGAFAEKPS
jgi:hydroxymethylbilane synthase